LSLNYIAVDGCSLEFQNGGSPNTAISITPGQLSTKVKADGKAVYKTIKFTISGYTASPDIKPAWVALSGSGEGEIVASSKHVKVEGKKVILEGDQSLSITIIGQEQQGQATVTSQVTEIVKVTKAGQTKVRGA
jgi:uncharacterized Zn-binding protein involved in type VI secretion